MRIKEILNTKVDIFRSADKSSRVWYTTTLLYFLTKLSMKNKDNVNKLRELNKINEDDAKKFKKDNLIACTLSATFNNIRQLHCIKEKTGLIAIDIDKDKNKGLDVDKAKSDVINLPFVAMSMLSCRGEGIWCLIPYNKDNDFKSTWNALYKDFLDIGYVIDNCKDETRLRLISWDDNILTRQNEIEVYDKIIEIQKTEYIHKDYNNEEWILDKDNIKDISIAIYLLVNYCGYTADDYNEWLLDGFRLATIPNKQIGLKLFTMISEHSSNFKSYRDVESKFNECCNTTTYTTNILGYYINRIKEHYGPNWKNISNELLKYMN